MQATDKLKLMTPYFETVFNDGEATPIVGTSGPLDLEVPISEKEVSTAIRELNSGKCPGEDGLAAEQFKNAGPTLAYHIAEVLNENSFNGDLGKGVVVAIPKPGKSPEVGNLRPITLLNTIRKLLSLVILNRIRRIVEEYLDQSQCGFRQNRGTGDAVWAHKFMVAKAIKYKWKVHILGIDLSKAFDTVNREKLVQVLQTFVGTDELKLIELLLADTNNQIRLDGMLGDVFSTATGVPQGDSLSPILFAIYLEAALRDLFLACKAEGIDITYKIVYADDVDFIIYTKAHADEIARIAPPVLAKWNLRMNGTKTELTTIAKKERVWEDTKKLGTLLGEQANLTKRKQLAEAVLNSNKFLWKKGSKSLSVKYRVYLYKQLVRSVLLYNCGTWGLNTTQLEQLESFDRRLLRRVIGVFHPQKISREALYRQTQLQPLRYNLFHARWNLFYRVLRMHADTPAMIWTRKYFLDENLEKWRGPSSTLPMVLNRDLTTIGKKCLTEAHLDNIQLIATTDVVKWEAMVLGMEKTIPPLKSKKSFSVTDSQESFIN